MENFTIKVSPEQLLSAASVILQKTTVMKNELSELKSLYNQAKSVWTGKSADKYLAGVGEVIPKYEQLISRYIEQANSLKQIADNYAGAQRINITSVEGLPSDVLV